MLIILIWYYQLNWYDKAIWCDRARKSVSNANREKQFLWVEKRFLIQVNPLTMPHEKWWWVKFQNVFVKFSSNNEFGGVCKNQNKRKENDSKSSKSEETLVFFSEKWNKSKSLEKSVCFIIDGDTHVYSFLAKISTVFFCFGWHAWKGVHCQSRVTRVVWNKKRNFSIKNNKEFVIIRKDIPPYHHN